MTKTLLNRNFFIILACDIVLLCGSLYGAYLVRFDFSIPGAFLSHLLPIVPVILGIKLVCFYFFDLYRGMWRFTSIEDLLNVIKAASLSTVVILSFLLLRYRFIGFSRSAFLIDWGITVMAIAGNRLCIRIFFQQFYIPVKAGRLSPTQPPSGSQPPAPRKKRLIIIGAGSCGEKIFREIRDQAQSRYDVVGYLDDDPNKVGKKLHGRPVRGAIGDLKFVARKFGADETLIAIPSATDDEMRRIVNICKESGLKFKTLPGYGELIDGQVTISAIREVDYRDLLGRRPVRLDEEMIAGYLRGRSILITGAGGSIGSELCRQIARFHPGRMVLLDRAESPLFEIEYDLKRDFPNLKFHPVLGDILDKRLLRNLFGDHRPRIVFHAAAYKHVSMLEMQPWKAVENNIVGTNRLVEVADEFQIERLVLVSTDKAVRPASVMGASKRVAEITTLGHNHCGTSNTRFMAVRFGNVVGSIGSVVPLFKKQIKNGGPVTVTHPEVTRFFMTIREACQLILQAGAMGSGGEIFILDMGTPVRIRDMARDLIRLSGFEPDVDVSIVYTGLRPGEKLFEELMIENEDVLPTPHQNILALKGGPCDLNKLKTRIAELSDLADHRDFDGIRAKLRELVPEYEPALKFRCHEADLSDPPSLEETATPSNMNIESVSSAT
jgi:FlaA1/EpsC-like NDP-sugar epimerase